MKVYHITEDQLECIKNNAVIIEHQRERLKKAPKSKLIAKTLHYTANTLLNLMATIVFENKAE